MKRKIKTIDSILTGGKILAFDLETSNLAANRGFILCAGAKWVGSKKIMTWRIDDNPKYGTSPKSLYDDSHIVKALVKLCIEAEAVVAHYGRKFDVPYLNTRAMALRLSPTGPVTVIDPWDTAKKHMRFARNDLGSLTSLLTDNDEKYHLPWKDWHEAQFGDRRALGRLVTYCKNDVAILEKVYLALRPMIHNHPYIGPVMSKGNATLRCPACGSSKTHSHDYRRTQLTTVWRRRCNNCGNVFTAKREKLT